MKVFIIGMIIGSLVSAIVTAAAAKNKKMVKGLFAAFTTAGFTFLFAMALGFGGWNHSTAHDIMVLTIAPFIDIVVSIATKKTPTLN